MDLLKDDESIQLDSLLNRGFVNKILGGSSHATMILSTLLGGLIVMSLLAWLATPNLDPTEPPLLKSRIPFIGHIISLIRFQNDFLPRLHKAKPIPIATLPMLNGKIYAVFDPFLIQSIIRNNVASFEPFEVDFVQKTFDLSDATFQKIISQPRLISDFTDGIHKSFQPASLAKMNIHFLDVILASLDAVNDGTFKTDKPNLAGAKVIAQGIEVKNLYLWCRDIMSMASTKAVYGNHDPFTKNPSLIPMIWDLEKAIPLFLLSLYPSITLPKGYKARETICKTMQEYYESEHDLNDPSVSALVVSRAGVLRDYGFTCEETSKLESILPVVATTNAIPTFFWLYIYVQSRPELVARLRKEVEAAATFTTSDDGKRRTVTFDIMRFDEQLPLMTSCYRETMRMINKGVSMRRAMADIHVTAQDGRTYLLKKGTDIHLSAGVTHGSESIWGADVKEFNAERFLQAGGVVGSKGKENLTAELERKRRAGFLPFGGGRHLCPGRNLAYCEVLGFMAVMLLRFDVEPLGMRFADLKIAGAKLSAPSCKPINNGQGFGARIVRRKEWEDCEFAFEC